jgi:hypothetical protein
MAKIPSASKTSKVIPFDFVIEHLHTADPLVKQMFGCYSIYLKDKIVLALRRRDDFTQDNGVWIATTREHHESLRRVLPSLRTISLFGVSDSGWQIIPEEGDRFEEEVTIACDLILKGDPRIGKIPKAKKKGTNSKR